MPSRGRGASSYLFTVRIWPEQVGNGHTDWRGKVHRVTSGETFYFHDWATLPAIFQQMLAPLAQATEQSEQGEDR